MRSQFVSSLRDPVRRYVLSKNPATFEAAVEVAVHEERNESLTVREEREGGGPQAGFGQRGAEDTQPKAVSQSDHAGIDLQSELFQALLAEEEALQSLPMMSTSQLANTNVEGVGIPLSASPLIPPCRYPLRSRGGEGEVELLKGETVAGGVASREAREKQLAVRGKNTDTRDAEKVRGLEKDSQDARPLERGPREMRDDARGRVTAGTEERHRLGAGPAAEPLRAPQAPKRCTAGHIFPVQLVLEKDEDLLGPYLHDMDVNGILASGSTPSKAPTSFHRDQTPLKCGAIVDPSLSVLTYLDLHLQRQTRLLRNGGAQLGTRWRQCVCRGYDVTPLERADRRGAHGGGGARGGGGGSFAPLCAV
ncbi:hypothetical protein HPB47_027644 [Ixodes persulcatus]|uniref:Uncharacterized protein n=1 Tax=Ixodes persulcatus TaxID=34615 RepID=A0AC60PXR7_IXOPE|nr:hypothetical protein HPB47_027644 [Ixodes persulcatus]